MTILFCRNSTWNGKVLSLTFILTNYLYVYVKETDIVEISVQRSFYLCTKIF